MNIGLFTQVASGIRPFAIETIIQSKFNLKDPRYQYDDIERKEWLQQPPAHGIALTTVMNILQGHASTNPAPSIPRKDLTAPTHPALANKAEAPQAEIEDEERIYCQADPVLDHAAPAEDTHARGQGPGHQDEIDRDARNPV